MKHPKTLSEACDRYINRSTLKSPHTMDAYRRSIDLFIEFLSDSDTSHPLPIQQKSHIMPGEIPLDAFSAEDAPVFLHFVEWMLTPVPDSARPYKVSTVELRLAGVQRWFQYLDDYGWLPPEFPLAKARRIVRDELKGHSGQRVPPQPPLDMDEVIHFYDQRELPPHLRGANISEARIRRWEVSELRNSALLHCLAESGGRISEILSLKVEDFPPRLLNRGEIVRIQVVGKGGHLYHLRFLDALPAIRRYLKARGADFRAYGGKVPLFVCHTPPFTGQRISRVTAWRVVQKAVFGLGLSNISPHDFRHWRATQLVNAGQPLDVVQDFLGHRSVETTRGYYARTDPRRVDAAAEETRLPKLGEETD